MDQAERYAAGLEQLLKNCHHALKETVSRFQEMCHMVTPDRILPHDLVVDIRKAYKEIQDQLTKIKGIQQLLEGRYRRYYRRQPLRDREILEFGFLAKNYYHRFEYTLKEIEAKRRLKEQEKRLERYGTPQPIPWFRLKENQEVLLNSLKTLNQLETGGGGDLWPEERRQISQENRRGLSLFLLCGEVDAIDELEAGLRLREYDIKERYGPDEFRGALVHLREISTAQREEIVRRLMQTGRLSKSKAKGLLFPIQSRRDLQRGIIGLARRLTERLAEGEVRTVSI